MGINDGCAACWQASLVIPLGSRIWRATHLWKSWAGDAAEMSLRMTRPPCEILMRAPMPARLEAVPCGVREQ